MIFWTTVLTFLIGLMTAMLFPRSDRINVEEIPISESYVASFVAQHQFARDYADQISFTLPYINPSVGEDKPSDKAQYIHIFKDEFDDINIGYMPEIMPDDVSRNTFPKDGSYTSAIVCMDGLDKKVSTGASETYVYGDVVSCQTQAQTFKYVLTYGALFPSIGIQHNLFKSRIDTSSSSDTYRNHILWEKALAKRTKGDPDCGFVGIEENLPYIFSANGKKRKIPYNLYKVFEDNDYFPGENTYDYQPIFCITPVNSPYVTDGLIYHFDATMNAQAENGAPLHKETKTEWLNIISQQPTTISGGISNAKWNPNNEMPLAMMKDVSLQIPIEGSTKITNEFTLSFVAQFDVYESIIDTQSPLFSTNNGSFPYIIAKYKSGDLTITIYKEGNIELSELKATIPHSITAISYVLGPKFHHLFINGNLAATKTFPGNEFLPPLNATTLMISESPRDMGGNKINADMYNIKIYNRVLNQDEIRHNLKTEKKRYKF